jgi:DNA-binding XRE family transcriptional regulator
MVLIRESTFPFSNRVSASAKKANRREEQFYLGLSLDAQIIYGMQLANPEQLQCALNTALQGSGVSQREIAKRTGLSRTTIAKVFAGSPVRNAHELAGRILKTIRVITQGSE